MRRLIFLFFLVWLDGAAVWAADCPVLQATGEPAFARGDVTTLVCHSGYAALHDDALLVPRWVAYRLAGDQTMGCLKGHDAFHAEDQLPAGRRAEPEDYRRSGYDRGHLAPVEDFAADPARLAESYSMANVVPQLPGLNREGWERLEELVRAWAWNRGALVVFSGPVLSGVHSRLGSDGVAVPSAFFKIIFDPARGEAIAFLLPQRYVSKTAVGRWVTSIVDIEARTGLTFPLPADIERAQKSPLWPADLAAWRQAHHTACRAPSAPGL